MKVCIARALREDVAREEVLDRIGYISVTAAASTLFDLGREGVHSRGSQIAVGALFFLGFRINRVP